MSDRFFSWGVKTECNDMTHLVSPNGLTDFQLKFLLKETASKNQKWFEEMAAPEPKQYMHKSRTWATKTRVKQALQLIETCRKFKAIKGVHFPVCFIHVIVFFLLLNLD